MVTKVQKAHGTSQHFPHWIGVFFSFLALGVAGLLIYWSLEAGSTPPGCGEGSGCASVLGSKYSRVFGMPVGVGAVLCYLCLGLLYLQRNPHPFLGGMVTSLICGSILWFVFIQLALVHAVCIFCMVDHALGGIAAIGYLLSRPVHKSGVGMGIGLVAVVALLQLLSSEKGAFVLPEGEQAKRLDLDGRRGILLVEGEPAIVPSSEPHFGNPDAERLICIAVDYACPHCRALHGFALEAVQAEPEHLGVVLLPTPLDPACNPVMNEVPDRFHDGCEIATLSLAVYEVNPKAWPAFDAWLFAELRPRNLRDVRERAAAVIDLNNTGLLERAREKVLRNVALFAAMPAEAGQRRVPVTWGVNRPPTIGPLFEFEEFYELTLPPSTEGSTPND